MLLFDCFIMCFNIDTYFHEIHFFFIINHPAALTCSSFELVFVFYVFGSLFYFRNPLPSKQSTVELKI